MAIDFGKQRKARAKIRLVQMLEPLTHVAVPYRCRSKTRGALLLLYNQAPTLARIYDAIGPVKSQRTFRDWAQRFRESGTEGLIDRRGRPRVRSAITPEMSMFMQGCKAASPDMAGSALHRRLQDKFKGERVPSASTVRRWIRDWKRGLF